MSKFKTLATIIFLFIAAILSNGVRGQSSTQTSLQQIQGWSDLGYLYDAPRNITFVTLRPQRVTMKQNEDIFDVDMKVLFLFEGTMADLKVNPGLPKQYNLHLSNVPTYPERIIPARFARLKMFSKEYGNAEDPLPLVDFAQSKEDILRGVQILEFVLGDIRKLLVFTLADDAILETSAGDIRLRASDLRYAGMILRYTTTLMAEKREREKQKLQKKKPMPSKTRRGK